MANGISLIVFLGTSLLILLVFLLLNRGHSSNVARVRELAAGTAPNPSIIQGVRETLARMPFASVLLGVSQERQAKLRLRFARAGLYNSHAISIFLSVKVLLASAGAVAAVGFGLAHLLSPVKVLPAGLGLVALGLLAPNLWLDARTARWQGTLRSGLPDAMDMLVLCLEGGASLTAAFQYVLSELRLAHFELGTEMEIVQREMRLGKSAGEAIQKFAHRCDLEDVRTLASVLLQNERYGVSVSKALRIHADTMRQQRQQRAEEMAQKAAVKILFPTLLCIFPAIFIVVLGPAAFQMAKLFSR